MKSTAVKQINFDNKQCAENSLRCLENVQFSNIANQSNDINTFNQENVKNDFQEKAKPNTRFHIFSGINWIENGGLFVLTLIFQMSIFRNLVVRSISKIISNQTVASLISSFMLSLLFIGTWICVKKIIPSMMNQPTFIDKPEH